MASAPDALAHLVASVSVPSAAMVLIAVTERPLDGFALLGLDPNYIGSCPCAEIEIDGQVIQLHCWRVDIDHDGCGIHYYGEAGRAVAERIKPALDEMEWCGDWAIVEGFR